MRPMTESEWDWAVDPTPLLEWVGTAAHRRRLRLFAVAWYRADWGGTLLGAETFAVAIAEALADGRASAADRDAAEQGLGRIAADDADNLTVRYALLSADFGHRDAKGCARSLVPFAEYAGEYPGQDDDVRAEQAAIIKDIFGNPFRPIAFDPRWRTADTVGLATGIYEDRAFDRLPVLADALMDAGCADEQVLGHCRSQEPHVRGCWLVDLVLGKD
jgi:hypothetical protein